jgi:hypothetical protein
MQGASNNASEPAGRSLKGRGGGHLPARRSRQSAQVISMRTLNACNPKQQKGLLQLL